MSVDVAEEYQALVQFLYLAPIGIVQTDADGEIVLVNATCSRLLMPLSREGGLSKLFRVLEGMAPDLRYLTQRFQPDHGLICQDMHLYLHLHHSAFVRREAQILSLTLLKLDGQRLTAAS